MMMMIMSCLSVCLYLSVASVYCGQTVAYFSHCSAELLFIDPVLHMQDSFCLFCFASYACECTTSVRL